MESIFLTFEQLSSNQLYDILALRQDVFIIEQQCLYNDIDGNDSKALHLLFYNKEHLIAYLRIFPPQGPLKETSLGRIVIRNTYRGSGIGKKLITKGISYLKEKFPQSSIRIEAQYELLNYYRTYGFEKEGEPYIETGIKHIKMVFR